MLAMQLDLTLLAIMSLMRILVTGNNHTVTYRHPAPDIAHPTPSTNHKFGFASGDITNHHVND